MVKIRWLTLALVALFGALSLSAPASAQATRTWVSGVGDDANPCSRTAPCKTFAGAISKTATNGEINCLDPAGFGGVTITKAITIDCHAVSNGGVLVSGTNGITINASPTSDIVLDGLDFEGLTTGLHGIRFIAGGSLTVQNCVIRNFSQNGISFEPSGTARLSVINTLINKSGTSATYAGIQLRPTSAASAIVTVNQTQILGSLYGIVADGSVTTGRISGIIRDSQVSGSGQNGITVSIGTAANITLAVDNVSVTGNGNNALAGSGSNAGMLVSNSTIVGNGGGIFPNAGSAIYSYGNNRLNGNNGNDGAFTGTIALR